MTASENDTEIENNSGRRLAAIMFTDMAGYTSLSQRNEALALELLEQHRRLMRPFFRKHNGKEIKTIGDAFLVEFASALEALRCAFEIQQALHERNAYSLTEKKIDVRIGIHLGDVIHDGSDVYGDAVNVASRIEPLAEAGGICISEQVYDNVRNKFEFPLSSLGKKELKNVEIAIEVFKVILPWTITMKEQGKWNADRHRIAVMPFANLISDPEEAYFADGMTEELISKLSLINELSVISRTSVMSYKSEQNKHAIDIGRELNVGTLLEGSVRKAGNRVRISVQLIDIQTDKHLWAENYDRTLEDVFAIQSDVAGHVAEALKVILIQREKDRIQKTPTTNLEAYALYMRGILHLSKVSKSGYKDAIHYFEQAIRKDPQFALAYSGMADSYSWLGFFGILAPSIAFPKAREFSEKALEIDELLSEAHVSLGQVLHQHDWDFAGAEIEFKRAIDLNPSSALAHISRSHLLMDIGRIDEAISESKQALELDPLSAYNLMRVGTTFLYTGNYDEAIELLSKALKIDSNIVLARDNLGLAYIRRGQFDLGIPAIEEATKASEDQIQKNDLAYAYVKAGMTDKARNILFELLEQVQNNPNLAVAIAGVYSNLGEIDKSYEWLEKAYEAHSGYLRSLRMDFTFENIRSDARYPDFLKKVGLEL